MEPIPAAMIAALTPADVEKRFYDDRFETIPFDEPTDLVAISVETYTAKRAYQIASAYRKRGVPVVMGGFHATLCPDEVGQYCESLVIGEAEKVFPHVVDDYRHGRPERTYRSNERPALTTTPDRSIFRDKRYLRIGLVEFARGCKFKCDFCAVQSFFGATQTHRPIDLVVQEIQRVRKPGQMIFFIDDNITSDISAAKELMRALIPLKIRWVSQSSINVAYDEEALDLMKRSGCKGLLVGFESLNPQSLAAMNKGFNLMRGGPRNALANFRRYGLRIYGTFIFGYDSDTPETFDSTVQFAREEGIVHRGVQSHHAIPGHAAARAHAQRGPPALRRLVAGRSLPLQHGAVSAQADERRGVGAPLRGSAASVLWLAEHPEPGRQTSQSTRSLHAGELPDHQRHAPIRYRRSQWSAAGR